MAALLLVVGLFVSSLGAAPSGAATQPQLIVSVSTDNSALAGAPGAAVPAVLAAQDTPTIKVTISLSDGTDLSKGTVINLTALHSATTGPLGAFSPGSVTVPTKGPSATFLVSYTEEEDGVTLHAAPKKASSTSALPGDSLSFDVLDTLNLTAKGDPSLTTGLGADSCTSRTKVSVCGVVILPNGIGSPKAALATGACTEAQCTGGKEVQFIAGLTDSAGANLYSRTNPATLVLQCDKTKCAGHGVSFYTAKLSLSATGPLTVAAACTSKGIIQSTEEFCVDYVASHKDNAGDVLLHVLFFTDMRGTI